jgi:hypothetical protein
MRATLKTARRVIRQHHVIDEKIYNVLHVLNVDSKLTIGSGFFLNTKRGNFHFQKVLPPVLPFLSPEKRNATNTEP